MAPPPFLLPKRCYTAGSPAHHAGDLDILAQAGKVPGGRLYALVELGVIPGIVPIFGLGAPVQGIISKISCASPANGGHLTGGRSGSPVSPKDCFAFGSDPAQMGQPATERLMNE